MVKRIFAVPLFLILTLSSLLAPAQAASLPKTDAQHAINSAANKLSLSAQTSMQVTQDTVHVTLFYEQQGNDAAALTALLKQKVDQALRLTQGQTKVSVQTGNFTVYPVTDREDQRIKNWRGRAEILLESNDFAASSTLAGRLTPLMQISGVRFSLSPKARREAQTKLTTSAIEAFREQAKLATQAFGYSNYSIVEVSLQQNGIGIPEPMMMAAFSSARASDSEVPLAAGKTTVTVSVSGTVRMVH